MIAIVRIKGQIGLRKEIVETLTRLRIRKKFSCSLIEDKKQLTGMLRKVENCVAYGTIDDKTLEELIEKRGQKIDGKKKVDAKAVADAIKTGKFSEWEKYNLKPFFRLHPPRGGIETKKHFPKGVIGNHKEKINDLIRRML